METLKSFDSIAFISDFGGNEVMLKVLTFLDRTNQADELVDKQYSLLYDAAINAAHRKWNSESFLTFYPEVKTFFLDLMQEERVRIEWRSRVNRLRNPGATGKVTVFCPRGCNQIQVCADEPWDECAACGQFMTRAHEDSYYDGLIRSGQAQ